MGEEDAIFQYAKDVSMSNEPGTALMTVIYVVMHDI
jgi:hypothetical protein